MMDGEYTTIFACLWDESKNRASITDQHDLSGLKTSLISTLDIVTGLVSVRVWVASVQVKDKIDNIAEFKRISEWEFMPNGQL